MFVKVEVRTDCKIFKVILMTSLEYMAFESLMKWVGIFCEEPQDHSILIRFQLLFSTSKSNIRSGMKLPRTA